MIDNIGANKKPQFKYRNISGSPDTIFPEPKSVTELTDNDKLRLKSLEGIVKAKDALDDLDDIIHDQLKNMSIPISPDAGTIRKALRQVSGDPDKETIGFNDLQKAMNIIMSEISLLTGLHKDLLNEPFIGGYPAVPSGFVGFNPCDTETGEIPGYILDSEPMPIIEYKERDTRLQDYLHWSMLKSQIMIWLLEGIIWMLKRIRRRPIKGIVNRVIKKVRKSKNKWIAKRDEWMSSQVAAELDEDTEDIEIFDETGETNGFVAEYIAFKPYVRFNNTNAVRAIMKMNAGEILTREEWNHLASSAKAGEVIYAAASDYSSSDTSNQASINAHLTSDQRERLERAREEGKEVSEEISELAEYRKDGYVVVNTGITFKWNPNNNWNFTVIDNQSDEIREMDFPGTPGNKIKVKGRSTQLWGMGFIKLTITPDNQTSGGILGPEYDGEYFFEPSPGIEIDASQTTSDTTTSYIPGKTHHTICAASAEQLINYVIDFSDSHLVDPFADEYNSAAIDAFFEATTMRYALDNTMDDALAINGVVTDEELTGSEYSLDEVEEDEGWLDIAKDIPVSVLSEYARGLYGTDQGVNIVDALHRRIQELEYERSTLESNDPRINTINEEIAEYKKDIETVREYMRDSKYPTISHLEIGDDWPGLRTSDNAKLFVDDLYRIKIVEPLWNSSVGILENYLIEHSNRWANELLNLVTVMKRWTEDYRNICCIVTELTTQKELPELFSILQMSMLLAMSFTKTKRAGVAKNIMNTLQELFMLGIMTALSKIVNTAMDKIDDEAWTHMTNWADDRAKWVRCLPLEEMMMSVMHTLRMIRRWLLTGIEERFAFTSNRIMDTAESLAVVIEKKIETGMFISLLTRLMEAMAAAEICMRARADNWSEDDILKVGSSDMERDVAVTLVEYALSNDMPIPDYLIELVRDPNSYGSGKSVVLPTRGELENFYYNRLGLSYDQVNEIFANIDSLTLNTGILEKTNINLTDENIWAMLNAFSPCINQLSKEEISKIANNLRESINA